MIWFSCTKCGKAMSRAESSAGALVFCDCGQGNSVPWESTMTAPPAEALPTLAPPPLPPLRPVPVVEEDIPIARPAAPAARRGPSEAWGQDQATPRAANACFNHQDRPGLEKCADCGENFCGDCLVKFKGHALCGPCKNFRLRETTRPSNVSGKAVMGVILALCLAPAAMCLLPFGGGTFAVVACGFAILGQLTALVLGAAALYETEKTPRLTGRSLAITTLLTGALAILVTTCFLLFAAR